MIHLISPKLCEMPDSCTRTIFSLKHQIAITGAFDTIASRSLDNGDIIRIVKTGPQSVLAISMDRDEKILCAHIESQRKKKIILFSLPDFQIIKDIQVRSGITCLAVISPDGELIAYATGKDVFIHDWKTNNISAMEIIHPEVIVKAAWSDDSSFIFCASNERIVRINVVSPEDDIPSAMFPYTYAYTRLHIVSCDGKIFASAESYSMMMMYDYNLKSINVPSMAMHHMASNGKHLAKVSANNVSLHDKETMSKLVGASMARTPLANERCLTSVAFKDDSTILIGTNRGAIAEWDVFGTMIM